MGESHVPFSKEPRPDFLLTVGSGLRLDLTEHALQFGVQYQPEETNIGRPNTTMMPSSTEMIQANAARGTAFGRFASVDSGTFANGSHLTFCNHNLEEQV